MAFGDVGGAVTELVITCKALIDRCDIHKGDALEHVGSYAVSNEVNGLFGQAMGSCSDDGEAIPVKVRGICIFEYVVSELSAARDPIENGGVQIDLKNPGKVTRGRYGRVLKVDEEAKKVHVLL